MELEMDKYFEAYLEEKFKGISENIGHLRSNQESLGVKVDSLVKTIETIKTAESLHFFDCPNTEELTEVKKNMTEILFIKKYWKVFVIAAAVNVGIAVVTGIEIYNRGKQGVQIRSNTNDIQDLQESDNKQNAKDYFENGSKLNPK